MSRPLSDSTSFVKVDWILSVLSNGKSEGVNFTNILRAGFMCADPKSAIKLLNLTVFFALLGSSCVKSARRMLVKLTPD